MVDHQDDDDALHHLDEHPEIHPELALAGTERHSLAAWHGSCTSSC